MANQELTIREKSKRVSQWFVFVGANLIAVMTYFILWVEDSRRLPVILAILPLQVVADAFLIRWRDNWKRIGLAEWLTVALLGWFLWSCIRDREWYLLPVAAFGFAMLVWRISKNEKRETHDGFEEQTGVGGGAGEVGVVCGYVFACARGSGDGE